MSRRPVNTGGEYRFEVVQLASSPDGPEESTDTLKSVISRSLESSLDSYGVSVDNQSSVPSSSQTASMRLGPSPRTGPTWRMSREPAIGSAA